MSIRKILYRIFYHEKRYINGTKGVISLFLAILMLPFTLVAGSLVNAARINSAVAIFDEALCNASNSTLGTYDKFLKKRFGLLAMSQDVSSSGNALNEYTVSDLISETFSFYLEENLKSLSNTYISSESRSMGVYPLADRDVLLSQILEYSKYSVPVKLVEEGLSINDMIASLENALPGKGVLEIITSGADVVDAMQILAEDYELLKTAVHDEEISAERYNSAFETFCADVENYIRKKEEIEEAENRLEGLYAAYDGENEEVAHKIAKQKETIRILNEELDEISAAIESDKSLYSSEISTLISKITISETKLTAVQKDIVSVDSAKASLNLNFEKQVIDQSTNINENNIKNLKEQISKTEDNDAKAALQEQINALNLANQDLKNMNSVVNAVQSGYSAAISSIKVNISTVDVRVYSAVVENLRTIKNSVDAFRVENVSENFNESAYYVSLAGLLTYDTVVEAEEDLVSECTGSSIWEVFKAIAGFIEALFHVSLVYNPELGAVIDTGYYKNAYGGLPSEKDRTVYALNYGEAGDAELSQYYKTLFGDYSSNKDFSGGEVDVIGALKAIFEDVLVITTNGAAIASIFGFLNLMTHLREMMDAAKRIVANLTTLISYLGNILSESAIGSKVLLSGYASYMTSNRITYTGKALTGTSYNERAQRTTVVGNGNSITDFISLVNTFQKAYSGGEEKCFVGAETEYIIFGSSSELANQTAAFGVIYLIRLLADIMPIISDLEVQSIAAASTIAAPFVYLIYFLAEPLADTLILVNGGNVPIYKRFVYLTPYGIPSLIAKFTSLKLPDEALEQAQLDLTNAMGAEKYAEVIEAFGTSEINTKADKTIFDLNYSQTLFLIMTIFTSSDKILDRLSNIIEMEAVEYSNNMVVGSNGLFDLDYSYTYIRTEASFSTNEFIKISNQGSLNSKKRIVYRGY